MFYGRVFEKEMKKIFLEEFWQKTAPISHKVI